MSHQPNGKDTEQVAPCYAVFGPNQIEHPGQYVVRRFLLQEGMDPMPDYEPTAVVTRLEETEQFIPTGMIRFDRFPEDDPSLICSYLPRDFFMLFKL